MPQLRGVTLWLSLLLPEVLQEVLTKDPEAILAAGRLTLPEQDRASLIPQILKAYDSGNLVDTWLILEMGSPLNGARLNYRGLANDLGPYIRDNQKRPEGRQAAILIAQFTRQHQLQQDLAAVALREGEPHEVRTVAVRALLEIGDERTKSSLTRLVTDTGINDPTDELKGGALIATWPNHLRASELFSALSPTKVPNFFGLYWQFLQRDIASGIRARDVSIALEWACRWADNGPNQVNPLRTTALAIVARAIDFFREPGVSERLVNILLLRARHLFHDNKIAASLKANPEARRAIARSAIKAADDAVVARWLGRIGVVLPEDAGFLISEVHVNATPEEESRITLLVFDILSTAPWTEIADFDQIVETVRSRSPMFEILRMLLGPIEWPSPEAEQLKAQYESSLTPEQVPPALSDQIRDVLGMCEGNEGAFESVCTCLVRHSGSTQSWDDNLLAHWAELPSDIQDRVVESAAAYVKAGCQLNDLSWIRSNLVPCKVMHGFWALRLISLKAPSIFDTLTAENWRDWMPCVFGHPYSEAAIDERHDVVLKTASMFARDRFLEMLDLFIRGQNHYWGSVSVINRVGSVWADDTRALLSKWLHADEINPRAFGQILGTLLDAKDKSAAEFANDLLAGISVNFGGKPDRPLAAAIELVSRDASTAWEPVWRAVEKNAGFAMAFMGALANEPFNAATLRVIEAIREDQVADVYIWLAKHRAVSQEGNKSGMVTQGQALVLLSRVVINHLGNRGTRAASEQLRRIQAALPDEQLDYLSKSTEELVRRKTWQPLSPSDLIELASSAGKPPQTTDHAPDAGRQIFRKDGPVWNVVYAGKSAHVKDTIGMKYMAHMLRAPGQSFSSKELRASDSGSKPLQKLSLEDKAVLTEQNGIGKDLEVLDAIDTARDSYRDRINELKRELAKAEHNNDLGQMQRVREEKDFIESELSNALRLGGGSRAFSNDINNARNSVSTAIARAIKTIGRDHKELATHLEKHIKKGSDLCYRGDLDWTV